MSMSLPQMVEEVKAARAAWSLILDRDNGYEGGRDAMYLMDRRGFGKLIEWAIEYSLPPALQVHAWLLMAGVIAAYDPARDPHVRAALGPDWEQRLWEELPAAVRLAFNESGPDDIVAPDTTGKGRSIASRTKRLMLRTGDEAAQKPKQVTSRRLEPEETELALFAEREAQGTSLNPEDDFFAYLSGLKPHQGETRHVVAGTSNIPVGRLLDEIKARTPFTKQETRVFDLLRETSDRHEVARRLGNKPESVTRTKTRIKDKVIAHVGAAVS